MPDVIPVSPLRIAPGMMAALFTRPLTATQLKVTLELVTRLGQQRPARDASGRAVRTIRVSHRELAAAVHARSLRSFRDAMTQFERWGILVVAEPPRGRRPTACQIVRPDRWALPAARTPRYRGVGQQRAAS